MRQAVRRKHHYIYKITRIDNGRYYIGMHSTDDLEDGYFGSGKLITASIKKHGKDRHSKEILEFFPTREALKLREKELVNEELLGDKLCMNLKLGGEGGGRIWSQDHLTALMFGAKIGGDRAKREGLGWFNKEMRRQWSIEGGKKAGSKTGRINQPTTLTKEARHKRIETMRKNGHQQGSKNSQFGKCWMTKDNKSILIKKDDLQKYEDQGYIRGRIMESGQDGNAAPC